ncbi:Phenylalanine aminomutase (L-beta-phenylalanine forming) [Lachnellula occidentalis]|uniref:Phenylalanine aminomutase (L-beta-phenylalanine forming) n=1 Tax=Lachnellula occidentalis TaxID=215460 RepID=A0A8H8RYT1_9HELO|nr:Phenylalanine aminomutase (L-beta-phenylalanine forming) [Lachnellula occidentalis]
MQTESVVEKHRLLEDDLFDESKADFAASSGTHRQRKWFLEYILFVLLTVSLLANVFLSVHKNGVTEEASKFAGLKHEITKPVYHGTQFSTALNSTEERDRLWNALDVSAGSIAIPDDEARLLGLPPSARLPWDQSVGIYLLGAFHQVHCLKSIYLYMTAKERNESTHLEFEHMVHCLDSLLQDAFCNADDFPWMVLPPEPWRQHYPLYQERQCKSWDKLIDWASGYNACYHFDNVTDAQGRPIPDGTIEHYLFCPEGSPYRPRMEEYLLTHEL